MAVVDRVRSIPLFYGTREQILYLSDDAEWVREQIADKRIDPVAQQEFLMATYVTGPDTLFPNLKQLQAGEMLHAKIVAGNLNISKQRYFRFAYSDPATHDESELRSLVNGAVERSIRRLIDYAAGRQIVLPLSGGYNSRLIAMMLNRMQYENVFTFTYGSADNLDTKYNQLVASELCFPWQFIECTPDKWRFASQTDSCRSHRYHGSGWPSLPHLQDWLAVQELKNQELVQHDCVFAPAHAPMAILSHL